MNKSTEIARGRLSIRWHVSSTASRKTEENHSMIQNCNVAATKDSNFVAVLAAFQLMTYFHEHLRYSMIRPPHPPRWSGSRDAAWNSPTWLCVPEMRETGIFEAVWYFFLSQTGERVSVLIRRIHKFVCWYWWIEISTIHDSTEHALERFIHRSESAFQSNALCPSSIRDRGVDTFICAIMSKEKPFQTITEMKLPRNPNDH